MNIRQKTNFIILNLQGSTEVRTRLYRMGITNNLEELKEDFYVYGMKYDETFEDFIIGEDYIGFLVTRKNKNIKL